MTDAEERVQKHMEEHAYLVAQEQAKIMDGYIQVYIKKRPAWLPHFLYKFILTKVLAVNLFKELSK